MCDNSRFDDYMQWIDESSNRSELLDTLYDIRDDILYGDEDIDDGEEGGHQFTLKR